MNNHKEIYLQQWTSRSQFDHYGVCVCINQWETQAEGAGLLPGKLHLLTFPGLQGLFCGKGDVPAISRELAHRLLMAPALPLWLWFLLPWRSASTYVNAAAGRLKRELTVENCTSSGFKGGGQQVALSPTLHVACPHTPARIWMPPLLPLTSWWKAVLWKQLGCDYIHSTGWRGNEKACVHVGKIQGCCFVEGIPAVSFEDQTRIWLLAAPAFNLCLVT